MREPRSDSPPSALSIWGKRSKSGNSRVVLIGDSKTGPASERAACAAGPYAGVNVVALKFLIIFELRSSHVHFALGSANYVAGPTPRRFSRPPWGLLRIDVGDGCAWELARSVLLQGTLCLASARQQEGRI